MKFLIVAALFIIASLSMTRADESRVYCGRVLADKMAIICDYGEEDVDEKRSGRNDIEYGAVGWFGPRVFHAYSGLRGKRGIIDDCCFQPCNIATLLSYC